jgi:hypothetical protein
MSVRRWVTCVGVAGPTLFVVGALFHLVQPKSVSQQYGNQELFRPWSGWTSIYMALHPFGFGAMFASLYLIFLRQSCLAPGRRGGLLYGSGIFLVGSLPVFLLAYASFNVSGLVLAYWILQNACQYIAAGLAVSLVASRS